MKVLSGSGNQLDILARVTPLAEPGRSLLLSQRVMVPPIEADAAGHLEIPGTYAAGPGQYRVDWMIRDRQDRVCSAHWEIEAKVGRSYQQLPMPIPADTVEAVEHQQGQEQAGEPAAPRNEPAPPRGEPAVPRKDGARSMNVKVLINFSPTEPGRVALSERAKSVLASVLHALSRQPGFTRFDVAAFTMDEQRVFYRQDDAAEIDVPALESELGKIKFGTVDYRLLQNRNGARDFLTTMITGHVSAQKRPDVIVIVGSRLGLETEIPRDRLEAAGQPPCPIFYIKYNADPFRHPWKDPIGMALKTYRGVEYSVTSPSDLGSAMRKMMERLGKERAESCDRGKEECRPERVSR